MAPKMYFNYQILVPPGIFHLAELNELVGTEELQRWDEQSPPISFAFSSELTFVSTPLSFPRVIKPSDKDRPRGKRGGRLSPPAPPTAPPAPPKEALQVGQ